MQHIKSCFIILLYRTAGIADFDFIYIHGANFDKYKFGLYFYLLCVEYGLDHTWLENSQASIALEVAEIERFDNFIR